MNDDDMRLVRRTGFQSCIERAANQLMPALIFPSIYRHFLRQECDAASRVESVSAQRLLERVGWSSTYYAGALDSDDERVDGRWGPQQLLIRLTLPIMQAFPERLDELRVGVILRVIANLGVPNEADERKARKAMLEDAERAFANPIEDPSHACDHAIRGLADLTAAELGVEIPWRYEQAARLGIDSPNSANTAMDASGRVLWHQEAAHDLSDPAGLAGAILQFMCWGAVFGATHVPDIEFRTDSANKFLHYRPNLRDRASAIIASLVAVDLTWTEAHIQRFEAAVKGHRLRWIKGRDEMHRVVLCRAMTGRDDEAPYRGLASAQVRVQAAQQIHERMTQFGVSRALAAQQVLEDHLLQDALCFDDWEVILQREAPLQASKIVADIRALLNAPEGLTVQQPMAGLIDAEGLPSLAKLARPTWVSELCEEARRHWADAESSLIARLSWAPTPRVPTAPRTWSSILAGFAHAVEAELCFRYIEPQLDAVAANLSDFPSAQLKRIRDEDIDGRRSIGSSFARIVLSRRSAASVDTVKVPCLGEMQFLLALRASRCEGDEGVQLMEALRASVPNELCRKRNTDILEGINRFRTDTSHPRRADSTRELTAERALFGRRIMVQYLHFLVQCWREREQLSDGRGRASADA